METKKISSASLRNYRGSARKARLLLDQIRGKDVVSAKNLLQFSTKKMSNDIRKLLLSAIANASQAAGKIDESTLFIESAYADEGITMKRMILAIKGMAYTIRKRHCHITLNLGQKIQEDTVGTKD